MDDKKLVCKADYEAAKARGKEELSTPFPKEIIINIAFLMYAITVSTAAD